MNRSLIFGMACGMLAAWSGFAGETVSLTQSKSSLDNPNLLGPQNPRQKPYVTFQANGGVTGGCYKVVGNQDGKVAGARLVSLIKGDLVKIPNRSDTLSFKLKVKGSGKLRLTFTIYNSAKKYFTQIDKSFQLNSPDAWKSLENVYQPSANNQVYLEKAAYFLAFLIVDEGEFLVDDWNVEVIGPQTGIVLDK